MAETISMPGMANDSFCHLRPPECGAKKSPPKRGSHCPSGKTYSMSSVSAASDAPPAWTVIP